MFNFVSFHFIIIFVTFRQRTKNNSNGINNLNGDMGSKDKLKVVDEDDSTEIIEKEVMFSLNNDDDNNPNIRSYKMPYTTDTILESYHTMNINQNSNLNLKSNNNRGLDPGSNTQGFTSSLNPTRQVHILPREIFDLLVSQAYLISGYQHTQLISSTARATVLTAACTPVLTPPGPGPTVNSSSTLKAVETVSVSVSMSMSVAVAVSDPEGYSYAEILWGDSEARARRNTAVNIDTTDRIATTESGMGMGGGGLSDSGKEKDKDKDRGRARSAGRAGRKVIRSTSKIRNSISGTSTGVSTGIGTGSLTPSTASSTTINAMVSGTVSTGVGVVHSRGGSREDSSRGVENGRRRASFPVCLTPALTLTPVLVLSSSSAKEASSLSTVTDDIIKDEADIVEVRKPRVSASITANLTVMSALSSDILKMMEVGKGSVDGIWFTPHPLQLQPVALLESMQAVSDCRQGLQLSIEKQQTWQLDLLRDYDEQRMFRYETFLSGLRSPSMEEQLKSRVSSLNRISATASSQPVQQRTVVKRQKNVFSTEYYRDRGRQSNK